MIVTPNSMCENRTVLNIFERLVSQYKYALENIKTAYSQKQPFMEFQSKCNIFRRLIT